MTIAGLLSAKKISPGLRLDAELLLSHIIKKPREFILAHSETDLTTAQKSRFERLWDKRRRHYPLAYLTGQKEFFGLSFLVNENVLIPRPETEFLVSVLIDYAKHQGLKKICIADIGTGSGNIAIALKKQLSNARVIGLDTSRAALSEARNNSARHKTKIELYSGGINQLAKKSIFPDVIISNLPYLDRGKKNLYFKKCPELKAEPATALFADHFGLSAYEELFRGIMQLKKIPQAVFIELGCRQIKSAQKALAGICGRDYEINASRFGGTAVLAFFKVSRL